MSGNIMTIISEMRDEFRLKNKMEPTEIHIPIEVEYDFHALRPGDVGKSFSERLLNFSDYSRNAFEKDDNGNHSFLGMRIVWDAPIFELK